MNPYLQAALMKAGLLVALVLAFVAGIMWSRSQIAGLVDQMAAQPTNSFTRCLTEAWEQSGELDPARKGKRKWVLKE